MKISRPVLFTIIAGVIGYAVVATTGDDTPKKTKKSATKTAAQVDADGFTKDDYNARFARYTERQRDPYTPRVTPHKAPTGTEAASAKPNNGGLNVTGTTGTWTLTGISSLDGLRSALIENSATHENVFLTTGERWHNYIVSAIEDNAVVLTGSDGKEVRLAFAEIAPANDTPGNAGTSLTGGAVPTPAPANNASTTTVPATLRGR